MADGPKPKRLSFRTIQVRRSTSERLNKIKRYLEANSLDATITSLMDSVFPDDAKNREISRAERRMTDRMKTIQNSQIQPHNGSWCKNRLSEMSNGGDALITSAINQWSEITGQGFDSSLFNCFNWFLTDCDSRIYAGPLVSKSRAHKFLNSLSLKRIEELRDSQPRANVMKDESVLLTWLSLKDIRKILEDRIAEVISNLGSSSEEYIANLSLSAVSDFTGKPTSDLLSSGDSGGDVFDLIYKKRPNSVYVPDEFGMVCWRKPVRAVPNLPRMVLTERQRLISKCVFSNIDLLDPHAILNQYEDYKKSSRKSLQSV